MPCPNRQKPTFGGTFAYVITFQFLPAHARHRCAATPGVTVEGFGCPEEYLACLPSA